MIVEHLLRKCGFADVACMRSEAGILMVVDEQNRTCGASALHSARFHMATLLPIQYFDPQQEIVAWEGRRLPHWGQAGTVCFATWRTWDSIPEGVLKRWRLERVAWLRKLGIDPQAPTWKIEVQRLPTAQTQQFRNLTAERWDNELDKGGGACVLRRAEFSRIVADSLLHFDGDRYEMLDFVVMPNHVHLLAAFPSAESMEAQFRSWKRFTSRKIQEDLGTSGRFWQVEDFDHLVRSEDQFFHFRKYIAENPHKANLKLGDYQHYSKEL